MIDYIRPSTAVPVLKALGGGDGQTLMCTMNTPLYSVFFAAIILVTIHLLGIMLFLIVRFRGTKMNLT